MMFYEKRLIESLEKKYSLKENIENVKIPRKLHIEVVSPIPVSVYYKLPGGPDPSMHGERRYETQIKKDIDCGYINIGNLLKEETEYRIIIYELKDMIRKKLINVLTRFVKQEKPESRITDVYPPKDISDYVYINGLSFDEFCNVLKDRMTESLNNSTLK